jgi:serine/threonine protein kinase
VDEFGSARLCDFGLASLPQGVKASTAIVMGSVRWMAPELFDIHTEDDEPPKPTAASDVYALSSVAFEVPYYSEASDDLTFSRGFHRKGPIPSAT